LLQYAPTSNDFPNWITLRAYFILRISPGALRTFLHAPLKPHVRSSIASSCDLCFAMKKYMPLLNRVDERAKQINVINLSGTHTLPQLSQRSLLSPGSSHAWFLRLSLVSTRPMVQFAIYI
jgi:hypothetical protein